MSKLGLFLILVGVAIGPLLSVRAVRAAMLGIESGPGEPAVQTGMNQVLASMAAGLTVALAGFVILMISRYRVHASTTASSNERNDVQLRRLRRRQTWQH